MKNLVFSLVMALIMVFTSQTVYAGVQPSNNVTFNKAETKVSETKKVKEKKGLKFFKKLMIKKGLKKMVVAMGKTLAIILTILLPGLVWLWVGLVTDWDKAWWICLLLCFLFLLPGWIYGLIKIIKSS